MSDHSSIKKKFEYPAALPAGAPLPEYVYSVVLERFYNYLFYEKHVSPHTIRGYLNDAREFLLFCQREDTALDQVNVPFLRSYFTERTGTVFKARSQDQRAVTGKSNSRKLSARSQARKISSLRTLYRILLADGIVSSNPAALIASPKFYRNIPGVIQPDIMTNLLEGDKQKKETPAELKTEIQTILEQRDRAVFELLYSTGMRIAELCSLELTDVPEIDNRMKITGKGNKDRIVFIGPQAKRSLNLYLKNRNQLKPKSSRLFLNARGGPLHDRGIRYRIEEFTKQKGITAKIHPHKFRHSFATDLLNAGADIRAVQELLGHSSISSTQVYTAVTKDRLKEIHRNCHPHGKNPKKK